MIDRDTRVRELLVGARPLGDLLAVTPIPAIFDTLLSLGWREVPGDYWWRRAVSGTVDVVLIPQGGAVADLGGSVGPDTRFELLGYAGSISSDLAVGDIVQPTSARLLGQAGGYPLAEIDIWGRLILTVPNLLASYDADPAQLIDVAVVDMESAHLAAAIARAGSPAPTVRVLVTDQLPHHPFFDAPPGAAATLRRRRRDLVDEFVAAVEREGLR